MELNREVDVARNVGLGDITFFTQVGYGGGAGCATVLQAATGGRDRAQCRGRGGVAGPQARREGEPPWAQVPRRLDDHWQWSRPFGLLRPVDEVAMLTRRYMHEYGGTRDHLANVALAFRKHANRNPAATMHDKPLTREQYLEARWISEPLCLFDNCLETDGALAAVLVGADRARRPAPAAGVRALRRAGPAPPAPDDDQLLQRRPARGAVVGRGAPAVARRRVRARRREGRADLRRVQPARPALARGLRVLRPGRGRRRSPTTGALEWPDGRLPTNTAGGGMSEAYVHGFNLVLEGVRQMRGTSTSQVDDADTCLVTSGEGVPTSALLLRN